MLIFLNCISLCLFSLGTYFIWWDKKNIFNHFSIGFCVIGFIIPSIIIDFDSFADAEIIKLYAYINIIGALFYTAGLILGYKWRNIAVVDTVMRFSAVEHGLQSDSFEAKVLFVSKRIFIVSLILMTLCFLYMGYLPIFAADPYSAKQFKGIYQPRYQQVALFYRTSKQFIQLLLPFFLIEFYNRRKISTLIMILWGFFLVFVSLSRSDTVLGVLLVTSIIISLKGNRKVFTAYIIFVVVFFSIGSSFWVIVSYYFPSSGFVSYIEGETAADAIAAGAPDILDQLGFLTAFIKHHVDYTYGLTFLGGLIPFNFKWNSSVWTLTVLNDTNDISEITSGGLRLSVPMWGYVSFGWIGACLLPFFSAFLNGYMVKKVKRVVSKLKPDYKGYILFYYLAFVYIYIGIIFYDFYQISIYFFPAFIFYGLVLYINKRKSMSV